jgi:hypothetical protein
LPSAVQQAQPSLHDAQHAFAGASAAKPMEAGAINNAAMMNIERT